MPRFGWAALLLTLAALLAVGGFLAVDRLADDPGEAAAVRKPELGTASVVRTDLRRVETFPAALRYTDPGVVITGLGGTITGLPEEGAVLERGNAVFEIDGQAVFLFYGERPMWRPLGPRRGGPEMSGADVEQLEANLAALGYPAPSPPDRVFDDGTARQIRAWRADAGLDAADRVEQGRVVYAEDRIRVGVPLADPGMLVEAGDPVIEASGTGLEVYLELPVGRRSLIEEGQTAVVVMPDEARAAGSVHSIGPVGVDASDRRGEGFVKVHIHLDDPSSGEAFGGHPVEVEILADEAAGVLAVPIKALLALAEGGYAVEVRRGGETVLTAVETGMYADGLVEVEGGLAAGDLVVVPR